MNMHRNAGGILPRRKRSSLTTLAFMLMCVYLFANCEQQLVDHIDGTLQYNFCLGNNCPKPIRNERLKKMMETFKNEHFLDDYCFRYSYDHSGMSCQMDAVRVNCRKTDGIFNCRLPQNDVTYFIFGHVHAATACKGQSYFRGGIVERNNVELYESSAMRGDLTTMVMTLKGTNEGRVSNFSVQCPVKGFNDSVQIVALVYRCF